jgi:hypothetical protein
VSLSVTDWADTNAPPFGLILGVATTVPAVTVKFVPLLADPCGVVTEIAPVAAPVGTCTTIWVDELLVMFVAGVPLNVIALALERVVPVIVTDDPIVPEDGVKLVIAVGTPPN